MSGKITSPQSQNTTTIGGVKFLKSEVQKIELQESKDGRFFYNVVTTKGTFNYTSINQPKNASIMNGELRNVNVGTYTGTKKQDELHLYNSTIVFGNFQGDTGNKDEVYLHDKNCAVYEPNSDSDDKFWRDFW